MQPPHNRLRAWEVPGQDVGLPEPASPGQRQEDALVPDMEPRRVASVPGSNGCLSVHQARRDHRSPGC